MICLCWYASATPVDAEDTCTISPQSVDNAVCARCAGVVHGGKFYLPMPALNGEDIRIYDFSNEVAEFLQLTVCPRGFQAQLLGAQ